MNDRSRTEYITSRMLADLGLGWMNTGGSQASRDGHLAGTYERTQREQKREQEERHRRQSELSPLRKILLQDEENRRQLLDEEERKLDELFHDTLTLGERVASGDASRAERDAYWFIRQASEARAKNEDDSSVRRRFSSMLNDLPERADLKSPPAPAALHALALALSEARRRLLDSGLLLPFRESGGRYSDFSESTAGAAERAEVGTNWFLYFLFPRQYSDKTRPLWLTYDAPLLALEPAAAEPAEEHSHDDDYDEYDDEWVSEPDEYDLVLNGDLDALWRRFQALDANRQPLIEYISILQNRFRAFLDIWIDRAPLHWLRWSRWESDIEVDPEGYFGGVLCSPEESLKFILDHESFLSESGPMRPDDILDHIVDQARKTFAEHQTVQKGLRYLREWSLSHELNPPVLREIGFAESSDVLDNVMEDRDQLLRTLEVISDGINEPLLKTLEKFPHSKGGPSLRASQDSHRKFFGVLHDLLLSHGSYGPAALDDSLPSLAARKVTRIRAALPDLDGAWTSLLLPKVPDLAVRLVQAWAPVVHGFDTLRNLWASGNFSEGTVEVEALGEALAPSTPTEPVAQPHDRSEGDISPAMHAPRFQTQPSRNTARPTTYLILACGIVILFGLVLWQFLGGQGPRSAVTAAAVAGYSTNADGVVTNIDPDMFIILPKHVHLSHGNAALRDDIYVAIADGQGALCAPGRGCTSPSRFTGSENESRVAPLEDGVAISLSPGLAESMSMLIFDGSQEGPAIAAGVPLISIGYQGALTGDRLLVGSGPMKVLELAEGEAAFSQAATFDTTRSLLKEDWRDRH